jgi:hypothetical protein
MKIESMVLGDGRKAERHITVSDDGSELIEIWSFANHRNPSPRWAMTRSGG